MIKPYMDSAVFSRETAEFSIFKKLLKVTGTINKTPWIDYPAETWLCEAPSAVKKGAIWVITCVFFLRSTGWNQVPFVDGSWKYVKIYKLKDFNQLGFSKEDFSRNNDTTDTATD